MLSETGGRGKSSPAGGMKVPYLTVSVGDLSAGSSMPGLFLEKTLKEATLT